MPALPPPRLRPREIVILACLALWVGAILRTQHAPPLTPPAVPYATSR